MAIQKILTSFLDALAPSSCLACHNASRGEAFCTRCSATIASENPPPIDRYVSCVQYKGPIRLALLQAKFQQNESAARRLISHCLRNPALTKSLSQIFENPTAITFVSAHWKRRFKRKYDIPPIIASTLQTQLKIPIRDLLTNCRLKPALSLTSSLHERRLLASESFASRTCQFLGDERIIIVDDIITTGATLDTCAQLLTKQGAKVVLFALARTPARSPNLRHKHF